MISHFVRDETNIREYAELQRWIDGLVTNFGRLKPLNELFCNVGESASEGRDCTGPAVDIT